MLPAFRSSALHVLLISSALTCTGVLAAPAGSADAMSFSQARQQFHERADVFRADAADVERARHAADSAKALSGPKVDLVAMQVEGRKDIELNLDIPQPISGMLHKNVLSYSTEYDLSGPAGDDFSQLADLYGRAHYGAAKPPRAQGSRGISRTDLAA